MYIKTALENMCNGHGMSGFEYMIKDTIADLFKKHTPHIYTDNLGNLICAIRCGNPGAKRLMLDAHMDEIGLMVTLIDEKGFLRFTKIGGVDERILPGSEVIVHGKRDICGIIGLKPPHLQNAEEHKKTLKIEDLAIDIGFNKEKAERLVSVGDSVTFAAKLSNLDNGQICAKSLDDRAGVAALLIVADKLKNIKLDIDVYIVLSVQEEYNLSGAKTAAYSINPDFALAIDVTHGITPDNSKNAFEVGSGPTISGGPNIHQVLFKMLKDIAKKNNITAHPEIDGGSSGTNAWAIQVSRTGVPSAVVSIPLKYMHTPVEVISRSDLDTAANLIYEFVLEINIRRDDALCF